MPRDLPAFQDNPSGLDFVTMPDDGRLFSVLHTAVGSSSYKEGSTITARHLGPGAQIGRLVECGAIRELSAGETEGVTVVPIVTLDGKPPVDAPDETTKEAK